MDSTLVIDALNGIDQAREQIESHRDRAISVVTWIEVLAGVRTQEEQAISGFLDTFQLIELSGRIAAEAVQVRRTTRLKLPDAIILASAHIENRIVFTRNTRDFTEGRFVKFPYRL